MNDQLRDRLYRIATSSPFLRVMRPLGLYPLRGSHSNCLMKSIHEQQIDCVLDVGAHYGEFGSLLRKIGYKGSIISFEPVSASFRKAQLCAASDDKWKVLNFALGSQNCSSTINVYQSDFFNSILPSSGQSERFRDRMQNQGTEIISIRSLDSVFKEIFANVSPRIFLKIDTQGYDREVFRGAQASLPYIYGLQSELGGISLYDGQPSMPSLLSEYWEKDYRPVGFFPVNQENDGLTVIEWDCILIRTRTQNDNC